MQLEVLLFIIALICVAIGVYFVAPVVLRNQSQASKQLDEIGYKHGLPILPRDERKPVERAPEIEEDALSSMAAAVAAAPEQAPIEAEPQMPQTMPQTVVASLPVQQTQAQYQSQPVSEMVVAESSAPQEAYENVQNHVQDEPVAQAQLLSESFDQNSQVLDQHLEQSQALNEDDVLLEDCDGAFSIVITPKYGSSISGRQVLDIARDYALKYGAMNMFHRFEGEDGRGVRWFSMMAEGREGPMAFDLNTITESSFSSLILFLVMPHKQPLRGYDSMVSTANMLSQKLNAVLTDENRNPLDDDYFARCRTLFINQ